MTAYLFWKCVNGVCTQASDGTYDTQAQCEAARTPPPFTGGQCRTQYKIEGTLYRNSQAFGKETFGYFDGASPVPVKAKYFALVINGALSSGFKPNGSGGGGYEFYSNGVLANSQGDISNGLLEPITFTFYSVRRVDGLADNCGSLPYKCNSNPPAPHCPPDYEQITCPGQPNGFCCISLALVRDLCSKL